MGQHLRLADKVTNVKAAIAQDPEDAVYVGDYREAAIFFTITSAYNSTNLLRIQTADVPVEGAFADVPDAMVTPYPAGRTYLRYTNSFGNYLRWRRAVAGTVGIGFTIDLYLKRKQTG